MVANSTSIRPTLTRDEAGRLPGQVMGLVAVTAGAFALGAYLVILNVFLLLLSVFRGSDE